MTRVSSSRPHKHSEKGAGVLETALVALTLIAMIIFVMDMGRILLIQQFITERARITVRQAVVNNWTATQIKNYLVYNDTTAPTGGGPGYMGLQTTQVSYSTLGTSGTPDYRVQVKVTSVPALTWIPYISGQYTLPPITATSPMQSQGATN